MTPPLQQQPRYLQLAQTLIAEIESGRYPVGGLIPTEYELCDQFGASRFTVREAIKRLVQLGMVTRQAGVGTRVIGPRQETGYTQVIEGLSDLHRYTSETRLDILRREVVEVSGDVAEALHARPGEAWLLIEALRRTGTETPLALSSIYIHPAFRGLEFGGADDHTPIYTRIEQQFGEQIVEVRQHLEGMAIDTRSAPLLGVKRGSPALLVTRLYLNRRGEIVEMAINIHPADRYSYSQTFRRDDRGALT
ncbi:GntR family transcriptional regulator [Sphingomonas abietis]|uniref:GntR family transcriptional regulator n=1 Tax=Sphingomonas abietis TaxID=3012344 RepID=A0ABY7NL41_9SPHN|nr:GntR family transcriptional regulator [Sphingomonas abietis]WBO21292.1 GntR family transcriptional regulator [Sphingomonas abietis]